jgi:hypothetical protein
MVNNYKFIYKTKTNKMMNIRFLKKHKRQNDSIQLAVAPRNKKIAFQVTKVEADTSIYKENKKYYINLIFSPSLHREILGQFRQIKKYVARYLYETKALNKTDTLDKIESSYETFLTYNNNGTSTAKIEIHPNCQFLKTNGINTYEDEPQNIEQGDIFDIIIVFTGVKYNDSKFYTEYHLYKIKKHFMCEIDTDDLIFSQHQPPLEYDDDKYVEKYNEKFKKI